MKKSTNFLTLVVVSLLFSFVISCNEKAEKITEAETETVTEPVFDLAIAKTEIQSTNNEFAAFISAVDSIGLSNLYTKDTKFMMTGAPSINGRENVQSTMSSIMNSGITGANLKTIEVWGTEDLITEEGEYSLFAGETKADYGKYIVLWKKVEGKWKLHRDIFNSDVSPPSE